MQPKAESVDLSLETSICTAVSGYGGSTEEP